MKQVEHWRWRYRNPATGQMCRTIFSLTAEEAAARYPGPQRIEGTMVLLREVELRPEFKDARSLWRDSSLDWSTGST